MVRDVGMLAIVLLLFASQTGECADQNMTKAIAHDLMTSLLNPYIETRFSASFRLIQYVLNRLFLHYRFFYRHFKVNHCSSDNMTTLVHSKIHFNIFHNDEVALLIP